MRLRYALLLVLAVPLLVLPSHLLATTAVDQRAGATGGLKNRIAQQGQLLSNTLAASRTLSIEQLPSNGTFGLAVLHICVTDSNNSVTALNMSCSASIDNSTTDYTLQSVTVAAGVGTSVDASWTKDPSGISSPKCWPWRVDIEGFEDVECTITNTGGTGSDTIVVYGALAVKGG